MVFIPWGDSVSLDCLTDQLNILSKFNYLMIIGVCNGVLSNAVLQVIVFHTLT